MVNLNRTDLDFLLQQVNIGIDYSQLINPLDPSGLREVAGTNNNLTGGYYDAFGIWHPGQAYNWGQSDQPFLRLSQATFDPTGLKARYRYGVDQNADTVVTAADNNVIDTNPRTISNLVSSMITDPAAIGYNPAAAAAVTSTGGSTFTTNIGGMGGDAVQAGFVPNAGVQGGASYNSWFVAFGQFFDHGLDFTQKGANGTITITLQPGDPLYVDPADPAYIDGVSNIMRMPRASLANPATDYDASGVLLAGVTPIYRNNTGPLIDQSQTYGSNASVNALLREYDDSGRPTGRVVAGADSNADGIRDGLATWADVKANALKIGVILTDADVHDVPVLRVDATGKLLFTPDALDLYTTAQLVGFDPANQDSNDPFVRDAAGNVLHTNQDFLIDYNPFVSLDVHYITGDGRANENIGLTSVHHVFHEEHNYQVHNIENTLVREAAAILADPVNGGPAAAVAYLNQWMLAGDGVSGAGTNTFAYTDANGVAQVLTLDGVNIYTGGAPAWNGESVFQAARIVTEAEYNHIAVDQYIRALTPSLPEFVSYSTDVNMSVSLEFSQAVFRLGHSMLTENITILDPVNVDANGNPLVTATVPLMQAFLNPQLYAQYGADDIALGLTRTLGNEVDEFVTPALQQSLLGQPLDLAAINIARGRDVGLPTLNGLRQQIFDGVIQNTNNTNGGALAPYTSWTDFGDHLRNPATLVNMIAAYARDTGDVWGIENARTAYETAGGSLDAIRAAAQTVVDAYTNLADPNHAAAVQFMQGTPTFNAVTQQWEFTGGDQGFWDVDLWIGGLAERPLWDGPLGTTFSFVFLDFAQRMQDGDRFYYLYRLPPGTNLGDEVIRAEFSTLVERATGLEHLNGNVFAYADKFFILDDNPNFFNAASALLDDGVTPASQGHIVIAGNGGNDYLVAGLGDDTVYGDAGDDYIQGGQGDDHLLGGDGNDTILDDENNDVIDGGAGNDTIYAGPGILDRVFGGTGDDALHGGDGIDELMGNDGDDMLYGDGDTDVLIGGLGNDFLDGGDSVDEMWSDEGNDWLRGGVGDDALNGGLGNDLLEGGIGAAAGDGDRLMGGGAPVFGVGVPVDADFDIASYEDVNVAIVANLHTANQNGTGPLIDTYAGMDGLVGTRFDDSLTGAGIDTISTNGFNNVLIGGAGNDTLTGLSGDDIIIGDSAYVRNDLTVVFDPAAVAHTDIVNWKATGETRVDFGVNGGLGHILGDNGAAGNADRAVFSGNRSDYIVTLMAAGLFSVVDTRGIDSTAAGDTVKDVELFQFADRTVTAANLINQGPTGAVTITGWASAGQPAGSAYLLTANAGAVVDPNGIDPATRTFQWQTSADGGVTWANIAGAVGETFAPAAALQGSLVRVVFSYTDDGGFQETVTSAATEAVGLYVNGTNASTTINGTANQDVLLGNGGNDVLRGFGGSDLVDGGIGNDTIWASIGDGNDTYIGGTGTDTLNLSATTADANVNLDTSAYTVNGVLLAALTATSAQIGTDALSGIERVIGSSGSNVLIGDAGVNRLEGLGGNDILIGGAGADALVGGAGIDTASYATAAAAVVASILAPAGNTGDAAGDTYSGIENLTGSAFGDTLTGNNGANAIDGGEGSDTINGGAGADRLTGGLGNDTLTGGAGTAHDTFVFYVGFGQDTVKDFHFNNAGVFTAANNSHDSLEFHGFAVEGISSLADLLAHTTYTVDANGVVTSTITIGGDQLVLEGANLGQLNTATHQGDFDFLA